MCEGILLYSNCIMGVKTCCDIVSHCLLWPGALLCYYPSICYLSTTVAVVWSLGGHASWCVPWWPPFLWASPARPSLGSQTSNAHCLCDPCVFSDNQPVTLSLCVTIDVWWVSWPIVMSVGASLVSNYAMCNNQAALVWPCDNLWLWWLWHV